MLAYAIALDAAQPWLDDSVSAPPWFGSGEAASLRASDLDVAYHGFMSAPEWGLTGRSEGGAEAAAGPDDAAERELLRELSQLETLRSEQAEGTANRETSCRTLAGRKPGKRSRTGSDALSRRKSPAFAATSGAARQNH